MKKMGQAKLAQMGQFYVAVYTFIAHYNRALAKPIKWTYTGRVTPTEQAATPAPPVQA